MKFEEAVKFIDKNKSIGRINNPKGRK